MEAESVYYTFEPVTATIDSETETLPDLIADRVQVCGQIDVGKAEMSKYTGQKRIIMIKSKHDYAEQKMQADDTGVFCTEVKIGEYTVTPLANLDDSAFELHLTPRSSDIKVEGPIDSLKFVQIKVAISGVVEYLDAAEENEATVTLERAGEKPRSVKAAKGKFEFAEVLPGSYKVSVVKNEYCWEKTVINVEIKAEGVKDVKFMQSGYALQYSSEKDVDVMITGEKNPVHFQAGDHFYCLKKKGEYEIKPMGCYKYPEKSINYSTSSPSSVKLVPKEYLVEGYVESKDSSFTNLNEHVLIKCKVNSKDLTVTLQKDETQKSRYRFQFYSGGNMKAEITPVLVSTSDGSEVNVLFNPKMREVHVLHECLQGGSAVTFAASKGLVIRGKVSPPIGGIEILARDVRDDSIADQTVTSATGEYKLGPLYGSEQNYLVAAHKEGYKITKDLSNPYDFAAEQLSYLAITVKDAKGNPLPDVAFDLSHSARTYRNNSRTSAQGKTSFDELIPGEYYLKPLLKEYEFEPKQMTLHVVQGKKLDKEFVAKRIAFSAYGHVRLLDQKALEDVVVDAVCATCGEKSMESGKTGRDGSFRIRGLVPGNTYEVSVRLASDRMLHTNVASLFKATPLKVPVKVAHADVKDVNFLALRLISDMSISGVVNFEGENTDYTTAPEAAVELYSPGNPVPTHREQLSVLRYFRLENLRRQEYIVKVVPTGQNVYRYNASVTALNLENDVDPVVTRLSEKHLNLTLHRLERKAVVKSR